MGKSILWIVVVFFVLIAGIILYSLARFSKLETHEYEIKENFENITITSDTAEIQLVLSGNHSTFVVCEEEKNANHSVTVNENTLQIEVVNNKKWYEHIGIHISTPKITVYLGKNEFGNILLKTDTGNISLDHVIAAGTLAIEADTGNVNFAACDASEVLIKTDTGNVTLDDVIARGKLAIEADTGNVTFTDCDASEVFIETDTGNVTGSFLTDKVVFAESNTGKIDVPKVIADEKCEIITDTGNIKITIAQGN